MIYFVWALSFIAIVPLKGSFLEEKMHLMPRVIQKYNEFEEAEKQARLVVSDLQELLSCCQEDSNYYNFLIINQHYALDSQNHIVRWFENLKHNGQNNDCPDNSIDFFINCHEGIKNFMDGRLNFLERKQLALLDVIFKINQDIDAHESLIDAHRNFAQRYKTKIIDPSYTIDLMLKNKLLLQDLYVQSTDLIEEDFSGKAPGDAHLKNLEEDQKAMDQDRFQESIGLKNKKNKKSKNKNKNNLIKQTDVQPEPVLSNYSVEEYLELIESIIQPVETYQDFYNQYKNLDKYKKMKLKMPSDLVIQPATAKKFLSLENRHAVFYSRLKKYADLIANKNCTLSDIQNYNNILVFLGTQKEFRIDWYMSLYPEIYNSLESSLQFLKQEFSIEPFCLVADSQRDLTIKEMSSLINIYKKYACLFCLIDNKKEYYLEIDKKLMYEYLKIFCTNAMDKLRKGRTAQTISELDSILIREKDLSPSKWLNFMKYQDMINYHLEGQDFDLQAIKKLGDLV